MATDVHHNSQDEVATTTGNRQSSRRRWIMVGLPIVGVSAILASAAALLPQTGSSSGTTANFTHKIARGDLLVTVLEQGTLESSDNTEIRCQVRGENTVIWVIESGTQVQPGDELVRLDTLLIEEQINERTKYAHWSRSAAERSEADVARSELAVNEYLEGRFVAELMTLEKDLAIAESNLRTAKNMLSHAKMMTERGYVSELEIEEKTFAVTQAELDVEVKKTEIEVLKEFTKAEELETLRGNLAASKARHEANKERAFADAHRRDRALEEFEHCVIKAEKSGMVIYPSAAAWKKEPDITEGATVHKNQVLLLMPDLSKMQVKVGIHESIIDRIQPGLEARVTLPDRILDGEVISVASVTSPAGWWTGNVVKYDTIIQLPSVEGLKPGMSAEVEVIMARHEDVLTIPVAAVLETEEGDFCWVKTPSGPERRELELGDSNDVAVLVKAGVVEGDEVVLNPLAFVEEAQADAAKTLDEPEPRQQDAIEAVPQPPADKSILETPASGANRQPSSASNAAN